MNRILAGQSLHDFEYTTDQSVRIARRMAHGVYRITHAGLEVGEEAWSLFALLKGGYRVMTEIDLKWPVRNEQRAHLDLDEHWNALGLWAQIDMGTIRRMAAYIPDGARLNVELTDLPVSDDDRRSGRRRLRSNINDTHSTSAKLSPSPSMGSKSKTVQKQIGFDGATHLDFASALFNYVVLQRLRLAQGTEATFNTIVISLPSLEPVSLRQTYRYEADEMPGPDLTQPPPRRYVITEPDAPGMLTTFWCDAHDIVMKQELMIDGASHGCEMINYRWQP